MSYDDKIFILSPQYALQKVPVKNNYKYYLFNTSEGDIYELNETAFDFLSRLDGKKKTIDIFEDLTQIYNTDLKTLEKDFVSLISEWVKHNIIVEKENSK